MSLHTLFHLHSFTVIISYLGLGQPPLQLRIITFHTLFINVYITSLVLLPRAARIMHFCKFYCHYHNCYTCINITGCNLKCLYQNLMWYYIIVSVQTFLFYIVTQRDIYRSLLYHGRMWYYICTKVSCFTLELLDVI